MIWNNLYSILFGSGWDGFSHGTPMGEPTIHPSEAIENFHTTVVKGFFSYWWRKSITNRRWAHCDHQMYSLEWKLIQLFFPLPFILPHMHFEFRSHYMPFDHKILSEIRTGKDSMRYLIEWNYLSIPKTIVIGIGTTSCQMHQNRSRDQ
jgi:hypothetical protein